MNDEQNAEFGKSDARDHPVSKSLIVILVISALLFASLMVIRVEQLNNPAQVVANAEIAGVDLQTIDGFGASGAWWSGPVYGMSQNTKMRVGTLLFSRKGLALSQFRYNIGGGGLGVTTRWKAPNSFLMPNGTYNFANNPSGIYFLKMSQSYGVHDLVGFVNSAPPQFTSNGLNCGGRLIRAAVPSYARYLVNVVLGIKRTFGIELRYLSPFNEPDFSMAPCKQEGMRVPAVERAYLISVLGPDLARAAPWCHIIADESSQVAFQMLPELPKWINKFGAKKYVAILAHHGYDYPGPHVLSVMKDTVAKLGMKSWMTEICCYNGAHFGYQYDPTMLQGMWLAKTIYNDLIYGGDRGFDWWTAISPNLGCDPVAVPNCANNANILGRNDGLVYYDINYPNDGDQRLYLTKRYFVFGNFSRFIQPGSALHMVTGLPRGVVALATEKQGTWSLVVVDDRAPGSLREDLRVAIPSKERFFKIVSTALTSANAAWSKVANASVSANDVISLSTSGQSVSSIKVAPALIHR